MRNGFEIRRAVDADKQRKGVASALINAVFRYAKEHGIQRLSNVCQLYL